MDLTFEIWDPTLQKDIDKLEAVQRRAARFIKQDYKSREPGCVTRMLSDLNLPPLQDRRKQLRLQFLYKIVSGQIPAIPAEKFMKPVRDRRTRRPKVYEGFQTANIVDQHARNNSRCFEVNLGTTDVFRNSFFPRTIRDWNSLEDRVVRAESIEEFKTLLSTRAH